MTLYAIRLESGKTLEDFGVSSNKTLAEHVASRTEGATVIPVRVVPESFVKAADALNKSVVVIKKWLFDGDTDSDDAPAVMLKQDGIRNQMYVDANNKTLKALNEYRSERAKVEATK